jgi:hypothetical protein
MNDQSIAEYSNAVQLNRSPTRALVPGGKCEFATRLWTTRSELTGPMWDFAAKKRKTNIAVQGGRTTSEL